MTRITPPVAIDLYDGMLRSIDQPLPDSHDFGLAFCGYRAGKPPIKLRPRTGAGRFRCVGRRPALGDHRQYVAPQAARFLLALRAEASARWKIC
jgi:hypothetical protein